MPRDYAQLAGAWDSLRWYPHWEGASSTHVKSLSLSGTLWPSHDERLAFVPFDMSGFYLAEDYGEEGLSVLHASMTGSYDKNL